MTSETDATEVPAELARLVHEWLVQGGPQQRGITWPRKRWVEAFPTHAASIEALPPLLDRAALRPVCSRAAEDPVAAEAAFIAVLAWGYGGVSYGPWRAQRALAPDRASERLHSAAVALAHEGPLAGYSNLAKRSNRLPYFGPAFGTKFLAFCSSDERPALILDRLVSNWIERNTGLALSPLQWKVSTYRTYLSTMQRWADDLAVSPEVVEQHIFSAESARVGNQWAGL